MEYKSHLKSSNEIGDKTKEFQFPPENDGISILQNERKFLQFSRWWKLARIKLEAKNLLQIKLKFFMTYNTMKREKSFCSCRIKREIH